MPIPKLTPDQMQMVAGFVSKYISSQRDKYNSKAEPISAAQRDAFKDFFSAEVLANTRVLVLNGSRIENPPFYPMIKVMGFSDLPDQSTMAAITFNDTVVSHEPFSNALLFHELVHVEQYRQLGIKRFSELYVRGFLTGGSYEAIPLEINAYSLDARYQDRPEEIFSVQKIVSQWIREDKF